MAQQIHVIMEKGNISNSIVAGRDVKNSTNANDSEVVNNSKLLTQVRTQAFLISLITGVLSSLIASYIFYVIVR